MASLFDMDSSSDSEADVDYEPVADEVSSDEEEPLPSSDDEEEPIKKSKTKQKKSTDISDSKKPFAKDSVPVTSTVDEKKRADDIYKSFLDEVAAEKSSKTESVSSGISCSDSTANSPVVLSSTASSPVVLSSTTSSPIVLSSTTSSPVVLSSDKNSGQSSVQDTPEKLFEFAGETISVSNDVIKSVEPDSSSNLCSKLVKNVPAATAPPIVKRKGLDSVLGTLQNKKQKITVMQKSMLDWQSFKKDEGLDQELEKFNRGKGGFIERQRFLQRSDLRSYEIERDLRMTKRSTQPKRDV